MKKKINKVKKVWLSLGLLIGIIGAAWLARRITTPLQKLVEGTEHISRGDFSMEIDPDCMNLDSLGRITADSPVRVVHENGELLPIQAFVVKDRIVLNPVTAGRIGFPPLPLIFDTISSSERQM